MTKKYPAPWKLKGNGYILLYKFPKNYSKKNFFKPEFKTEDHHSSYGAIMLADYENSTAGPYKELLFTPGKFKFNSDKRHSITKIYVSTQESVDNGQKNWGIPKELADFTIEKIGRRKEKITVFKGEEKILEMTLKKGYIPFPVSLKLLPFPLIQKRKDTIFYTNFDGKGIGRISWVSNMKINTKYFPDISNVKPLLCVGIDNFDMVFPEAEKFSAA